MPAGERCELVSELLFGGLETLKRDIRMRVRKALVASDLTVEQLARAAGSRADLVTEYLTGAGDDGGTVPPSDLMNLCLRLRLSFNRLLQIDLKGEDKAWEERLEDSGMVIFAGLDGAEPAKFPKRHRIETLIVMEILDELKEDWKRRNPDFGRMVAHRG